MEALGVVGFALLLGSGALHLADVAALARRSPARAALAFFLPPLAALWAWESGARRRAAAFGAILAGFAAVVAAATLFR